MIKLKLRSGSGTATAHGRNVTRFISHCGEVDEGCWDAGQRCPMGYKERRTLGGHGGIGSDVGQGLKALATGS
jgi:hypothetical protein